ncbi:MAG: hypothetical protein CBB97_03405 [Candidatus Endolissoclinum sp. TMED37]|nr:MAG: hypothetical protein CBB97_03405 [Candidatus Endolissoclinum sp. TMED37]
MAKFAITLSFNEQCGTDRARYLTALILNRAGNKTFGRRHKKDNIKTIGAVDSTHRQMTHIHIMATIHKHTADFAVNLQESCKHFNERFESFIEPVHDEVAYLRYISSKRITNNTVIW